jgi:OOP family OmpA-OmpF porin
MMAGGDLTPVTPYEEEDIKAAEVVPVTIPTEPAVQVAPVLAPAEVSPFYVGLGLVAARYDAKCASTVIGCTKDDTGGVLLRGGYDFNKYLGLEARAMVTSYQSDGGKIQHVGAFVKPMYPVTDEVNLYALGGLAKTTTVGSMRKTDVTGLAFGGGVEYDLSDDKKKDAKYDREFDGQADQEKGFGVFADYERLYYKSGSPDLDAVSVGLTYDF